MTRFFTDTNCKLYILWAIGSKRHTYNFVVIFREYCLKIQTCRTAFWWATHFHLPGTVNKQNFWYSSAANPHELHQRPLHYSKITVFCAVWSRRVIGSYFFEYEDGKVIIVILKRYTDMINEFLVPVLLPNHNLWFQQDGATAHMAVIRTAALHAFVYATGDFYFRWCVFGLPFAGPNSTWYFSVGLFGK